MTFENVWQAWRAVQSNLQRLGTMLAPVKLAPSLLVVQQTMAAEAVFFCIFVRVFVCGM